MNHFELFGLPTQFSVDGSLLASKFRELQRQFHPDNVATGTDSEKLQAVQKAATINDAYQVLKSPILRAEYLLAIAGFDIRAEQKTLQDPLFLMEQMELREQLEEIAERADADEALFDFAENTSKMYKQQLEAVAQQIEAQQWEMAADSVRKLKFIDKLLKEIERIEEKLF
jgi:molecular chaperone HscB